MILGITITLFDLRFPSMIATFFSADVLQDADEVVHDGKCDIFIVFDKWNHMSDRGIVNKHLFDSTYDVCVPFV